MKKTIVIITAAIISLLLIFTIPIPTVYNDVLGDGSALSFNALTYQIIKWDMYPYSLKPYQSTEFFLAPNNFQSVEALWEKRYNDLKIDGYGAVLSYAVVTEKDETGVLVDEISEDKNTSYSDCSIGKSRFEEYDIPFDDIAVGTKLEITYDGMILYTYPSMFSKVYKIELYE